jgi:hypothetical protein
MQKVYIAGPMRGYPKFNFPAFDAARDLAKSMGLDPISPADIDRDSGFHENDPNADVYTPEVNRTFARRDVEAILALRAENGDAIALLPGWEASTGAVAELTLAKWVKLRILDATTMQPYALTAGGIHPAPIIRGLRNALENRHLH